MSDDENNPNSEFGATPDSESESFKDNSYDIRDAALLQKETALEQKNFPKI